MRADPRDPAFVQAAQAAMNNAGRKPLSDEELVLLACEELSRTHTHEEKNYGV